MPSRRVYLFWPIRGLDKGTNHNHPDNLFVFTDILRGDIGVTYCNARASGRQLFKLLNDHAARRPDLILLDISIPHEDGCFVMTERVAIYGDFDADGVTATALLVQALRGLGMKVESYIPQRAREGYGLNLAAVEHLAARVDLLITVDCGIANVNEIERAQALGVDVIVVDHHTPPAILPPACAIINPKQPHCTYPYKELSGVGLAFKVIQALHQAGLRSPLRGRDLLDLVALGTMSDQAPLHGENRVLVRHGLRALNQTDRLGLRALLRAAGVSQPLDARAVAFDLGPRLNAAGRMDDAALAYDLLLTQSGSEATQLAVQLDALNRQRQAITKTMVQHALQLIAAQQLSQDRVIVLVDEAFPAGIIGLVAGRLVDLLARPVILLATDGVQGKGSARSIAGYSLVAALAQCAELVTSFGGHEQAAGCAVPVANVPELRRRLNAHAAQLLPGTPGAREHGYDAELTLDQLTPDLFDQLAQLEPCGQGCPAPRWVSRDLQIGDVRVIGKERAHLKLQVRQGATTLEAVMWNQAALLPALRRARAVDALYSVERKPWQGVMRTQLILTDVVIRA